MEAETAGEGLGSPVEAKWVAWQGALVRGKCGACAGDAVTAAGARGGAKSTNNALRRSARENAPPEIPAAPEALE